jgi:3D (Asp-Asp-Asp) domain-containing protein
MPKTLKSNLILVLTVMTLGGFSISHPQAQKITAPDKTISDFLIVQENSLIANSSLPEPVVAQRIKMVATAYSSTPQETDDEPFITAAGTRTRDGIVANNLLPMGTKIRIPELYGDKIFVVEDRMNSRKGSYQIDIWFPSYWEAKNFGAKLLYVEVLES